MRRCTGAVLLLFGLAGAVSGETGTAFVVGSNGYLLTCNHVVAGATEVTAVFGEARHAAQVLASDAEADLAVLKIEATGLTALPLGNSNDIQVGETVRTFGFPLPGQLGTSLKVTTGAVSGFAARGPRRLLQVDAPINPGGSGGPLVDAAGRVIGVVSAKLPGEQASNVGFVVPINYAKPLLRDEGVEPAEVAVPEPLEGPELVRRVGPSVAFIETRKVPAEQPASPHQHLLLQGHRAGVAAAAWSPDGTLIATGSHDHTARLWDAATGEARGVLQGHRGCVHALVFSPDGTRLATGGPDGTVRIWSVATQQSIHVLEGHGGAAERLAFSPDGRLLATATIAAEDPAIRLWDVAEGKLVQTYTGHREKVMALSFAADGRWLLSASDDGTARVWDVPAP